jgi:hypothetical protein
MNELMASSDEEDGAEVVRPTKAPSNGESFQSRPALFPVGLARGATQTGYIHFGALRAGSSMGGGYRVSV